MSKLFEYLGDESVNYKADVQRLRAEIPQLKMVPPKLVEQMYSDFCDGYSASWLDLDDETIENFRGWLS